MSPHAIQRPSREPSRRGAVVVLFAFLLVLLMFSLTMAIDVGVEPVTRAVHDQSECGCAAQGKMKLGAWPVKRQMVFTSDKPSDALDLGRTEINGLHGIYTCEASEGHGH